MTALERNGAFARNRAGYARVQFEASGTEARVYFSIGSRLGSEDPERRARDEMALEIEGIVDGGGHAEKSLGGARATRAEGGEIATK